MADNKEYMAQQAQAVLNNKAFNESFGGIKDDIVEKMTNLKLLDNPEYGNDMLKLGMQLQALDAVILKLTDTINTNLIHGEEN